ncbi:MAG: single-stranded-DNA-specific exonuclease RecJ [Campylobacterota bacterium]|nr:single-stranded-DNA-specific exonuclease RecJ [Campylobacterota bacterium]
MNNTLTIEDVEDILYNRIKDDQYQTLKSIPQPETFKDMQKATNRIVQAIQNEETINLVGDYDVDGISSTTIMVEFFTALGVDINYIIPNRFEHGYGLSPKILEQIFDGLIITVDNGISAYEAADICKSRGLDLIITDHHTVGEKLPFAYAIINPKQSDCTFAFSDICGAQVAWYLCASLKKALNFDYNLMQLFDILALAIVADIMPMVSLNKTMVKAGLKALQTSQRPCIVAIRKRYGLLNITEEDIGFKIAPLINCAGRMADPIIALEFLLSFDEFEANSQLDYLVELNEQRKQEQLKIFQEAKLQVDESDEVVVVSSQNWNEGIIGIVASKLCEKYKKPAFVFSINKDIAKASSRSTSKVNLYNLIESCSEVLNGFGGHKQAAGMSIDSSKLEIFKNMLNQSIKTLPIENDIDKNETMGVFCLDNVNETVYNTIESYRPFGQENPYPIFTFRDMKVLALSKMGKNKEFTKLIVSNSRNNVEVVIFVDFEGVNIDDTINFTATISKNEFRGEVKFNLMFKELLTVN